MPSIRLPPELCDQIIDHAWDDNETLKACSLTCWDWVHSSRYHLFRIIRLRSAKDCAVFHELVKAAPAIARYVREFTISADYCGYDNQGRALADDKWVDNVAEVASKLTRVSTLALSRLRWGSLAPETKEALLKLANAVKTLLLFEVTFNHAADMLEFLSAFPALTELYLHAVNWGDDINMFQDERFSNRAPIRTLSTQSKMQLSYLFLDTTSSPTMVTEWILSHPTENCLRTIQLCWRDFENTKLLGDLLTASGTSLEWLHVEFPLSVPEEAVLENHLSLAQNTGLRSIYFAGLNVSAYRTFFSTKLFPWLSAMLSQVRSRRMQDVSFELDITTLKDLEYIEWDRIDEELSRDEFRGVFVKFYVGCPTFSKADVAKVKLWIEEKLPGFLEKGWLEISIID